MKKHRKETLIRGSISAIIVIILGFFMYTAMTIVLPDGSWINIVDGQSMYPTLEDGQIIYTDMSEIEQGDIIMLQVPEAAVEKYPEKAGILLVKRVIGMPGDFIELKEETVFVNGNELEEVYLSEEQRQFTYMENKVNKIQLGEDEYYVMGDNREVSYDSRSFGAVKEEELLFKQSEEFTANFYKKCIVMIVLIAISIVLYFILENAFGWLVKRLINKKTRVNRYGK